MTAPCEVNQSRQLHISAHRLQISYISDLAGDGARVVAAHQLQISYISDLAGDGARVVAAHEHAVPGLERRRKAFREVVHLQGCEAGGRN
jgi:hypothetical protein